MPAAMRIAAAATAPPRSTCFLLNRTTCCPFRYELMPLPHREGGVPEAERPEHDRDEVLHPRVKRQRGELLRWQVRGCRVDEHTNERVANDEQPRPTEQRPQEVHAPSPISSTAARSHWSDVGAVSDILTTVPAVPTGVFVYCDQKVSPTPVSTHWSSIT